MKTLDAQPLIHLINNIASVQTTTALKLSFQNISLIPIQIPINTATLTTITRSGSVIAYITTSAADTAALKNNATFTNGTIWISTKLFGTSFATASGWIGLNVASATLATTGNVKFTDSAHTITLDATAALEFTVTSSMAQAAAAGGTNLGQDFTNARLTPFAGATLHLNPTGATLAVTGTASATLFGETITTTALPGAIASYVQYDTPYAAIPVTVTNPSCSFSKIVSTELGISGSAPIIGGCVLFPIMTTTPTSANSAVNAWGLAILTGTGLQSRQGTLTTAIPIDAALFGLTASSIFGIMNVGETTATERYTLWQTPTPTSPLPATQPVVTLPPSQISLTLSSNSFVSFFLSPGNETILELGTLDAYIDRPLHANGSRIPLQGPALLERVSTPSGTTISALSQLTPNATAKYALMAENAITPVGAPNGFFLNGILQQTSIVGTLEVIFPATLVLPTLPDPYAALYVPTQSGAEAFTLFSTLIHWDTTLVPRLAFTPLTPANIARAQGLPAPTAPLDAALAVAAERQLLSFSLLDVSSKADQWGVGCWNDALPNLSFDGICLEAPNADTFVFTSPGISWEPVVNGDAAVPAWLQASTPNDGIPTVFLVERNVATPILAVEALIEYQHAANTAASTTTFTLPFGINALVKSGAASTKTQALQPTFESPDIQFIANPTLTLQAARVLSIRAKGPDPLGLTLPGLATVGYNKTTPTASAYGSQALGIQPIAGPNPASFWDQQFASGGTKPCVPISRVDLSGYGTTLFSEWRDPSLSDVGVVYAGFDVLQGRTNHERVVLQTWILPWSIRLQRSLEFDRGDNGEVVKYDSGWHAVDVGKFELLGASVMSGPISHLANVRNISFSTSNTTTVNGKTYTAVNFEADVVYASSLSIAADGKSPAPSSVGLQIQGYADDTVGHAPAAADIVALLAKTGRVTGSTMCIAHVGGSTDEQFTMSVSGFGAAVATGSKPKIQTMLLGTPHLPKDGQWSVSRRPAGTASPQTLSNIQPVPLTIGLPSTKPAPQGGNAYTTGWRMLDPEDAQNVDAPKVFYGLLQGTGAAKTLFEHPLISDLGKALGFGNPPSLADVGSLLGIGGIFPDLSSILSIPSTQDLALSGDGFQRTYTWNVSHPDRSLIDLAIVHLLLSYSANGNPTQGTLLLDATATTSPTWQISLENLAFLAKVDGFGSDPLLTITGDFAASSQSLPTVENLNVEYGSALAPLQSMFSGLSELAKSLGGSANLDVAFSGQTLTVQQGFTLPTIPLGFGEITNLGINLGCSATIPTSLGFQVGIGSQDDPFQWIVDPLTGTGAIVLGVQNGALAIMIEAGIGVGIALSVAVASGSASIVVSMSIAINGNIITIVLTLTGNADVDVLGGLASASLTLSAALGIRFPIALPPPEATITAQVSVGIHISICWVISVDFDGSWSFSETLSLN